MLGLVNVGMSDFVVPVGSPGNSASLTTLQHTITMFTVTKHDRSEYPCVQYWIKPTSGSTSARQGIQCPGDGNIAF